MIGKQTSLSRNIVQFCRFLRLKGFALGVTDEAMILNALLFVELESKDRFALVIRAICCRTRSQQIEFDALFNQYWVELNAAEGSKIKTAAQPKMKPRTKEASFKSLRSWLNGNRNNEIEKTAGYSIYENLSRKDFSAVPAGDLDELMRNIKALSKRLATRVSRRYKRSGSNNLPDLRATMRKNMRHGGEWMEIALKKPKPNRLKLVILCDVSQSMDLYTAFLLQFLYAFQQVFRGVETFAFSTSMQCLTNILKRSDFDEALRVLTDQHKNWSGGTRIGQSLHDFIDQHGNRLLDKRTTVIILSDGWDTGEIDLLCQSMKIIKNKSKKIIWLNPTMGYEGFKPAVAGMRAAVPFVNVLAPAHNLDSLRKLGQWL